MVTLSQVCLHLQPGAWLVPLDLKDAYWQVPIHHRYRKFVASELKQWTFQFTVLPFSSSLAPRVFMKIVWVVLQCLLMKGVDLLAYLDNW